MSRQLDQGTEDAASRKAARVLHLLDGGLYDAVLHTGRRFTGLSWKYSPVETLLVIKATLGGEPEVCFVGSETVAGALLKAEREAKVDKLRWRADKWG